MRTEWKCSSPRRGDGATHELAAASLSRPFMVAGIWHDLDRYWPVLTFGPEDPAEGAICAVKSESRRSPAKAALIALIDLKQTQLVLEPICKDTQARRFMSTMGYTARPDLDPLDVMPAEDVRESDETGMNLLALAMYREAEEYIRIGNPPIFKETSERLIGMGLPDDEAIGLMCKALVDEYFEPNHEITPESIDRIILILSPAGLSRRLKDSGQFRRGGVGPRSRRLQVETAWWI